MKNLLLFLFLLFILSACSGRNQSGYEMLADGSSSSFGKEYNESYADEESQSAPSAESLESDQRQGNTSIKDRKIIKTGQIRAEVKDLKKSSASVEAKIKKHQGFVASVNNSNGYNERVANYSIRVPHDQFDALLNDLGEEALYLEYKNINAQDVSEEYFDLETRLVTKKTVRDRYIDILKNKAKTVEEILLAEDKIRVIQEEIESREGRLNYLKNQVSLSTIKLHLYQSVSGPIAQQPSFFHKIGRAFGEGWKSFLQMVIGLVYLWPIILSLALLFYLLQRFWWKKRTRSFPQNKDRPE